MIIQMIIMALHGVFMAIINLSPQFPSLEFIMAPIQWVFSFMLDGAGLIWWLVGSEFMNAIVNAYLTTFIGFNVLIAITVVRGLLP